MRAHHPHHRQVEPQVALSDAELMEASLKASAIEPDGAEEAGGEPVQHPEGAPEGLVVIPAVIKP